MQKFGCAGIIIIVLYSLWLLNYHCVILTLASKYTIKIDKMFFLLQKIKT